MAHAFTYLRIADPVTRTVTRLASGRCGSTLAGRGLHPLDDVSEFQEVIASSIPSDQPCLVARLLTT